MAENNKVTIDAAWFAELYARRIAKPIFSERMVADGAQAIRENEELRKERDELKAKLAEHAELLQRTETERVELKAKLEKNGIGKLAGERDAANNRLAAAERCIEDIEELIDCDDAENTVGKIIREWREKEAR